MSLDLFVLAPANTPTFEHAMNVVMETQPGVADTTGELEGYAQEVYNAYSDEDWPFAGDPIAEDSFVQLVVAPESWSREVPKLVERAHIRGLVAVDPQWGGEGKLFPVGDPYPVVEE
jgi:hypothetical protein